MRIEAKSFLNKKEFSLPCTITKREASFEIEWQIPTSGLYSFEVTIFTDLDKPNPFIPAIWYRGNIQGEGCFPSERLSREWSFYENRMPIPGLIALSDKNRTIVSRIDKANHEDELAAVSWNDNRIIYTFPGEEAPFSYQGKTSLIKDESNRSIKLEKGSTYKRIITLFSIAEGDSLKAYESFLRQKEKPNPKPSRYSWHNYECAKLTRILNLIRKDNEGNAFLIMGEGNNEMQSVYNFTAASFLVKSLEAASALLRTDQVTFYSDNKYLKKARKRVFSLFELEDKYENLSILATRISNFFLKGEVKPGFFQDNYNIETGELGGYLGIGEHPDFKYMVNARCNGEAMSAYLDIYAFTKDERILNLCDRVARFYIDHQLKNGSFGRWWNLDGISINSNGTNGAYIASFLTKLLRYEDKEEVRTAVNKALFYYSKLALSGEFYADTLDADSSDKEAGVSLLALFLEALDSNIGDRDVLTSAAKYSASFILSYIFQEELFLPKESPLIQEGFSFIGMTSVSIAHHHLDFYGMLIAKYFFRLAKITNDSFYSDQAQLMANACRQLIGDEENNYLSRDSYFYGWQPEQINYTSWEYFSRKEKMNGHFDIDIAWLNVLGYSSYLDIKELL